jgi:hypothetical protein
VASAQVSVIAPARGQIQGINRHEKGDKVAVDHDLASVLPEQFEALVLPGGVADPHTSDQPAGGVVREAFRDEEQADRRNLPMGRGR